MGKPRKGVGGRPPKVKRNEEERALVIALAKLGYTNREIVSALDVEICETTLRNNYSVELRTSRDRAIASIGEAMQKKALDGDLGAMNSWLNWFGRKPVREQEQSNKASLADLMRDLDE